MIEVRSYRKVFDLERRIYSVDRLRLNPGGVPVRGVVYFLLLLLVMLALDGLPLIGAPFRVIPWPVRYLLGPGALAAALSLIRIDGRAFHLAARSIVGFAFKPRALDGLQRTSTTVGSRWMPQPLTMLPDGSDARLRNLRYQGPGTVLIMVEHRLGGDRESRRHLSASARRSVRISAHADGAPLESGRVLSLERGVMVSVAAASESQRQ